MLASLVVKASEENWCFEEDGFWLGAFWIILLKALAGFCFVAVFLIVIV